MSTKTLVILGIICLIAGAVFASLTFTGTLTWGFNIRASYQAYVGGKMSGIMTGRRIIETNNGALALPILPLLITGSVLLYSAARGIPWNDTTAGNFLGPLWIGAFLSFPIYAIVFVNLLYDSGLRGAAGPAIVMLLPLAVALLVIGARNFDRNSKLR